MKLNWMSAFSADRRFQYKVWPRGDCWEWRGQIAPHGYGQFTAKGTKLSAHRYAYEMAKGPIPWGYEIDHLCRHPWCVRPSHLEAVTHVVNNNRSDSWSGKASRQTHCKHGHEFDDTNTYRYLCDGAIRRACRACQAGRARERYRTTCERDRDLIRARGKAQYYRHRERILAKRRANYWAAKDRQ